MLIAQFEYAFLPVNFEKGLAMQGSCSACTERQAATQQRRSNAALNSKVMLTKHE